MRPKHVIISIAILFTLQSFPLLADGILRVPIPDQNDIYLPLTAVFVEIELHDQVTITTVRNSFLYEGDEPVRAMYHYRLPSTASVNGFGVWRNGELIEYELRPGEQGGAGGGIADDPDLREYLGDNSFSAPLDSIQPGVFMIQIRFVQLLPFDHGVVLYEYPLETGRYCMQPIDTIMIDADVNAIRAIEDLEILTYQHLTEFDQADDYSGRIIFRNYNVEPEEDWCFNVLYRQENIGAWLLAHRSDPELPGYFMLMIEPGIIDTGEAVRKYFTFVLDRSGSMFGDKLVQAKQAVLNCLDQLMPHDYFNIIDFATDVRVFNQEMLAVTPENIEMAQEYIEDDIEARGLTNIYGSLMEAVGMEMGDGSANQIIFTTDGIPTAGEVINQDEILDRVTENNQYNARIYSFSIGNDAIEWFLTSLSDQNRGISIIFDPNEARIDSIITDFYRYVAVPVLVNPVVEIPDDVAPDSLYPLEFQDITSGKQLMLFGRYSDFGEISITLSGQMSDGDTSLVFDGMEFPEEEDYAFVPRMWAKSVIDYWLKWITINGEDQDVIDKIIELSIAYGILTPYTEYSDPPDGIIDHPVISRFDATPHCDGLLIEWTAMGLTTDLSYNIFRSYHPNGIYRKLNQHPLRCTSFLDQETGVNVRAYYRIEILYDGTSWMSEFFAVGTTASSFIIDDPYPNPFNDATRIRYILSDAGQVKIELFNLRGEKITDVFHGYQSAGTHALVVNGKELSTGMYLLRIQSGRYKYIKRLTLVR